MGVCEREREEMSGSCSSSSVPRRKRKIETMTTRSAVWVGGVFLLLGSAIVVMYLRLWAIDSTFSSHERELLRQQFDRAHMEAMDESAEWRMKFDAEADRSKQYMAELLQVKDTFSSARKELERLKKENIDMNNQVESLKAEIHLKQHSCHCNLSTSSQL